VRGLSDLAPGRSLWLVLHHAGGTEEAGAGQPLAERTQATGGMSAGRAASVHVYLDFGSTDSQRVSAVPSH